ncbi:major facilitator superfamily domain-containing protein 6-A-like [Mizuhopecten yessoensis]|uniref:Major facilitator superfamily domain-containing protein 6 n=1 Tax=Mizuhopecten yessoensis TaxID=6573 RepID=A0A210PHL6_MIZYE|nr:major facilitator superfamily domain-containing protein 6-A-like [Mizuhopecten yessoensis]XP_021341449.1 major facilitator superfamily domain-containing protein 6-A-like [Mizuhopecten yessoensis]XP_021341450.1 major facilitator superfamily domain-containing protein 6-A-like [Mizuhopecten yessoensis]OWF35989.1 Major facilitator superfamily domain-containing protein 6 [Mizuhopecten yessoensis]
MEDKKSKVKWNTINMGLLPIKAFFFLSLAGVGVLLPFIALYMKQIGLTTSQTGFIYGVMPFIGFFTRPIFGYISDRWKKHKLVLITCCVLTGIFYLLLLYVPHSQSGYIDVKTDIHCGQYSSYIRDCYHVNRTNSLTCPLSFDAYANLSKGIVQEKSLSVVGLKNSNDTGLYLQVGDSQGASGDSSCSFSCHYKTGDTFQTKACFTNQVDKLNKHCYDISVSLDKEPDLEFSLRNISNIISREVVQDQQIVGDLVCRDFDIKSVAYQEKPYWQMLCDRDVEMTCSMKCFGSKNKTCELKEWQNADLTIALFFVFFLFGNIFFAPIISIGDAMTYDILGDQRNQYGKQRLWGTLGFALFSITSSFLMEFMSTDPAKADFTASFYLFLVLFLLTGVSVLRISLSEDVSCSSSFSDVCKLFRYAKVMIFLGVVLYFGLLTGVIETFLYWYLSGVDGYITLIPGLCLLVSCFVETPVLFLSGYIIKRIGHLFCLYIVFGAYALRFFFYSLLTNAWYVLPVEVLHSITFGLMWATSTSYASIISPPGMSATVQGIIGGLHFGFGKGIGSIVTGQIVEPLGFVWTFRLYSFISVGFLILYIIINRLCLKQSTFDQTKEAQDNAEEATITNDGNMEVGQNLLSDQEKHEMEPL